MLMQNFGGQVKSIMVFLKVAYFDPRIVEFTSIIQNEFNLLNFFIGILPDDAKWLLLSSAFQNS